MVDRVVDVVVVGGEVVGEVVDAPLGVVVRETCVVPLAAAGSGLRPDPAGAVATAVSGGSVAGSIIMRRTNGAGATAATSGSIPSIFRSELAIISRLATAKATSRSLPLRPGPSGA